MLMSSFIDWSSVRVTRSLVVFGETVTTVARMEQLADKFKRNKAWYRACIRYLGDEPTEKTVADGASLQRCLNDLAAKTAVVLQGGIFSIPPVKVEVDVPILNALKKALSDLTTGDVGELVANAAIMVVGVCNARSWVGALSAFTFICA